MKASSNYFRIADFLVNISFAESKYNGIHLIPSFSAFATEACAEPLLFTLTVDDTVKPVAKEERERIRRFDTGNGETVVDRLKDGGYQFIIKDLNNKECSLLIADSHFTCCRCALNGNYDMRCFGLNNALMLVFAFSACFYKTLLIHASLVRHDGYGYAFNAKSGTGKSTQVSLWLRHIPNCDLMNDDNPVIRMIDGKPYIYGSPWSGKTPCYRNTKAPLGAITRIDRAKENSIKELSPTEAFGSVLTSCSTMRWDGEIFENIFQAVREVIETTKIYTLHCLPNKEAAIICNQKIKIKTT